MSKIAYYPGCTLHASSELYDIQSRMVMKRLDIELKELDDWNCCGATSASKTDDFLAIALPARNLGIAEASGLSELFIPCSSCYSRTLVSQQRLSCDPALKSTINEELSRKVTGSTKIVSILELLLPKVASGELSAQAAKKLEGLKPACYYGCLLTRFPCDIAIPDNVENPQGMEKICSTLGAKPVDWSYKTDCCGASATVNDTEMSLDLMYRIVRDAAARGANCFVTTCPMCQMNLDLYQEKIGKKYGVNLSLPVYFITELIGVAMGMPPGDLQIDRHFTEAVGLLKELQLV